MVIKYQTKSYFSFQRFLTPRSQQDEGFLGSFGAGLWQITGTKDFFGAGIGKYVDPGISNEKIGASFQLHSQVPDFQS